MRVWRLGSTCNASDKGVWVLVLTGSMAHVLMVDKILHHLQPPHPSNYMGCPQVYGPFRVMDYITAPNI